MKLLGWMHRKLMQNSAEPMKNSTIGNRPTCFSGQTMYNEQNYHTEPTKTLSHLSINTFEAGNVELFYQEESFDQPFEFLSIGTFGIELHNTGPPTPTLPMPVETLTGQQIEITENDLDLINYELEKFLEAEETEIGNDTSERSSQASIITLTEGHMQIVACPLQNYLFAASVGLDETTDTEQVKKTRTSLEELFKENNIVDDGHEPPVKKGEKVAEKEARKGNVALFMKKVVKRFNPTTNTCTAGFDDDALESNPIKKRLSKTLVKMFHKKVYPEEATEKQSSKAKDKKKKKKKNTSNEDDHHVGNNKFDQSAGRKSKKKTIKLFFTGICRGASPVNTGHWIKTDSDYLVLEL